MPANMENSAVATGVQKVSFHSNPKEGQCQRMFKLPHNCTISHASKVMLKILQARLQQYVNWELPDVQAGLRKSRGTRGQIANICWIIEKAREFQKNIWSEVKVAQLCPILCDLTDYIVHGILQARILEWVAISFSTTYTGSSKKQENSRKTSTFALLTTPKPLTVWVKTNYEKFL